MLNQIKCCRLIALYLIFTGPIFSQKLINIAVIDFENIGISESESKGLSNRVRTIILKYPWYQLIERAKMESILKEQNFQLSGCTSDECVVEVGQLLGVEQMLAGSFGLIGSTYTIDMRIIEIATGKILNTTRHNIEGRIDDVLKTGLEEALDALFTIPHKYGSIFIQTLPAGAHILINGEEKGISPTLIEKLPAETVLLLKIQSDNYNIETQEITLKPGERRSLKITLNKLQGLLTVTGTPKGAIVSSNYKKIGTTPLINKSLTLGDYQLKITKQGYQSLKSTATITENKTTEIPYSLELVPKGKSLLLSLILPGSGQLYQGYNLKGLTFLVTTIFIGYSTYESQQKFSDQKGVWEEKRDEYNHNTSAPNLWPQQRQAVQDAYDKLKKNEQTRNLWLGGLGLVWTVNVIEIIF